MKGAFLFPARQFVSFLLMAVLLVFMAVDERRWVRAILMVLVLVLYVASFLLFAKDYDRLGMEQWKKKEERLRSESAG